MRSAARSGSTSSPAQFASRNSSARCGMERQLSAPPSIRKCVWWPFRYARNTTPVLYAYVGGLEDVARQRDAGRQRPAVTGHVPPVQGLQRGRRSGCDRVEDPQQRVAVPVTVSRPPVSQYQPVVVQVVACVHAHTVGEERAHLDLALLVEQRDLDPVDLGAVLADDAKAEIGRAHV